MPARCSSAINCQRFRRDRAKIGSQYGSMLSTPSTSKATSSDGLSMCCAKCRSFAAANGGNNAIAFFGVTPLETTRKEGKWYCAKFFGSCEYKSFEDSNSQENAPLTDRLDMLRPTRLDDRPTPEWCPASPSCEASVAPTLKGLRHEYLQTNSFQQRRGG